MPPRSTTSTRAPLTRRRILEAALTLIDERGLDDLTMRALGAELGVEAMSIYKHVPGKGAVLDGVVELLLEDLEADSEPAEDWRGQLTGIARRMRALSHRHPSAFPLLRRRSVSAYVVGRQAVEDALRMMIDAGFAPGDAVNAMRSVMRFVLGFALSEPGGVVADDGPGLETPTPIAGEFPLVAELLGRLTSREGEDELFEYGLRALIAGIDPSGGAGAPAPRG